MNKLDIETQLSGAAPLPLRRRVLMVFDTYYSNRDNIVGSYASRIIDQLDFCDEFQIVTRNVYRGADLDRKGMKIEHFCEADRHDLAKRGRRLKNVLAGMTFAGEGMDRWHTDITAYREVIMRLLFEANKMHAVIIVSQTTSFALAVARLCHLFSDDTVPHIVAVTPARLASIQTLSDLNWLGVTMLQDGEVPAQGSEPVKDLASQVTTRGWLSNAMETVLERIPGTRYHAQLQLNWEERAEADEAKDRNETLEDDEEPEVASADDSKPSEAPLKVGERRAKLADDTVLFVRPDRAFFGSSAQFEKFARDLRRNDALAAKRKGPRVKKPSEKGLPRAAIFERPAPFTFFDDRTYPYRVNISRNRIDWSATIGAGRPRPKRVRDIVLFVRPDWAYCGSGTYFESLARYFRDTDTLIVDVAIWPFNVPFQSKERIDKVREGDLYIRAAATFFLRQTKSWARNVAASTNYLKFWPRTSTNQVLLSYGYVPKPDLMEDVIAHARITKVYLNHYFTYGFAQKYIAGRKFFLDTHDIQSINAVHHMYRNKWTGRLDTFDKLIDEEMRVLRKAERVSFVSKSEIEIAKRYLDEKRLINFIATPNVKQLPPKPLTKRVKLLFVASRNPANEINIDWFLVNVWPYVLKRFRAAGLREVTLDVCGNIKSFIGDAKYRNIKFLGMVDKLDDHYKAADLVILPVVSGGGAAMKTIEALLYGRPVVGTKHAYRGLPPAIAEHMGYHDDPKALAEAILAAVKTKQNHARQLAKTRKAAQMMRDEDYFGRLTESLESVRSEPKHRA